MIEASRDIPEAPPEASDADVPFRCDVSYVDEHATVAVRGELDLATAPVLLREVLATLVLPVDAVTVDLALVTFLDSSGIHTLLVAKSNAEERGIAFTLASVSRQGHLVLEVSGLSEHFGLTPS